MTTTLCIYAGSVLSFHTDKIGFFAILPSKLKLFWSLNPFHEQKWRLIEENSGIIILFPSCTFFRHDNQKYLMRLGEAKEAKN